MILKNNIDNIAVQGWFRKSYKESKPKIFFDITSNPETRNAALNVMYDNYQYQVKFYGAQDMSFEEFLYTPIMMYRGGSGTPHTEDIFYSYTFNKTLAQAYAEGYGKVYCDELRPIDTLGSIFHNSEAEIIVPTWLVRGDGKTINVLNLT